MNLRIFRRDQRASTKHLCLVWLIKKKEVNSRFAVTVARLQQCTQRNHLKRLLREIARNSSLGSCLGLDIILIARG